MKLFKCLFGFTDSKIRYRFSPIRNVTTTNKVVTLNIFNSSFSNMVLGVCVDTGSPINKPDSYHSVKCLCSKTLEIALEPGQRIHLYSNKQLTYRKTVTVKRNDTVITVKLKTI